VGELPVCAGGDVQLAGAPAAPDHRPSTHVNRHTSDVPLQPTISVEWPSVLTQPPVGPGGMMQPTTVSVTITTTMYAEKRTFYYQRRLDYCVACYFAQV